MSTAIVLREKSGLGQSSSYDTLVAKLEAINAFFNSLPDSSLTKSQMITTLGEAINALTRYNAEGAAVVADQQRQINALSAQLKTAQQAQQSSAQAGGVSSGVAAAIAVGSAVAGGITGYAIRGRK
jgi:Tfp pilus assembly protein FimV